MNGALNLLGGLASGFAHARQAAAERGEKKEAQALQKEIVKLQLQEIKTKAEKDKFVMELLRAQGFGGGGSAMGTTVGVGQSGASANDPMPGILPSQATHGVAEQIAGTQMGLGMKGISPEMAVMLKMAGGPDLFSYLNYMQDEGRNRVLERQGDERIGVSRDSLAQRTRANDMRETEMAYQNRAVHWQEQNVPGIGRVAVPVNRFGQRLSGIEPILIDPAETRMPIKSDDIPTWRNENGETPRLGTTPEQAMARGFNRVGATQVGQMASVGSALDILAEADGLIGKVFPKTETAMGRLAGGLQRKASAIAQTDVDAVKLEALLTGTLAPIIRSLGEKGTLAEGDVVRAMALMPKLTDRPEVAKGKIDQIRTILGKARDRNLGTKNGAADFIYNPATGTLEPAK